MLKGMIKKQIRQVRWDVRYNLPNITWLWDLENQKFPLSFNTNHGIELDFNKFNMANTGTFESFPIIYNNIPIICIESGLRSLRN
jgi:hypothetical protein